jgi:hypothetical protein
MQMVLMIFKDSVHAAIQETYLSVKRRLYKKALGGYSRYIGYRYGWGGSTKRIDCSSAL